MSQLPKPKAPRDAEHKPLEHYVPDSAPGAPYTKVRVGAGAAGAAGPGAVELNKNAKGSQVPSQSQQRYGDTDSSGSSDADFEIVPMPVAEPPSKPAAQPASDMREAERHESTASSPKPVPRARPLFTIPAPPPRKVMKQTVGDSPSTRPRSSREVEEELYEPMENLRPSQSSPGPATERVSAVASRSRENGAATGPAKRSGQQVGQRPPSIKYFEDGGSLSDSFEYEPLEVFRKPGASPLVQQHAEPRSAPARINTMGQIQTSNSGTLVTNNLYEPARHFQHQHNRPAPTSAVDSAPDGEPFYHNMLPVPSGSADPESGQDFEESFEYQPVQVLPGSVRSTSGSTAASQPRESYMTPARPFQPPQEYLSPADMSLSISPASGRKIVSSMETNSMYAYASHDKRYAARTIDSAESQSSATSKGSYIVSEKEWLNLSRPGGQRKRVSGGGEQGWEEPHYVDPSSLPGSVASGSLPPMSTSAGYVDFIDPGKSNTTVGSRSTTSSGDSRGSNRRQSTASVYQPLVMPEHFLPSAAYYERLMRVTDSNRKHRMAMLPPVDASLPANEQYRHRIVQHLLETEESYIKTLKLLLDTYAPAIDNLPSRTGLVTLVDKLRVFFTTIQKIFSLHHMFKIGLSGPVSDWNAKQKIGTVFEGAFSKIMAVEVYSEYIEQFSTTVAAIQKGRRKQALFAEVLRCCDAENGQRLNLESLLLRPVQRFPQFLLILQDLLQHTEKEHPDRVPLQLALTRIENVTEQLNQRKRLSDQLGLVERLRSRIMNLPADIFTEKCRLVSQDEVCQVKVKQGKAFWKKRCLFLFCNQLICTSVLRPSSPFAFRGQDDYAYKFKWKKPLSDVSIISSDLDMDTPSAKVVAKHFKSGPTEETAFPKADGGDLALQLRHERATLLYDMNMITKIAALVATLRQNRPPITMQAVQEAAQTIQLRLTVVEEELRRCEAYRLDIALPESGTSMQMQHLSFVMSSPSARFNWVKSFNRTRLSFDESGKPSWLYSDTDSVSSQEQLMMCSLEFPLLAHTVPIMLQRDSMTLELATEVCVPNTLEGMEQYLPPYLWVCSNGGAHAAQISIIASLHINPVVVECFQCVQSRVLCMMCVPGADATIKPKRSGIDTGEEISTVWLGTQSKTILVFKAGMSDSRMPTTQLKCVDSVLSLEYYDGHRFAGLADGSVVMFYKNSKGAWDANSCSRIILATDPVTCCAVFGKEVFLAGGREIHVIDTVSKTVVDKFHSVENAEKKKEVQAVHGMLGIGIGLWMFHRHSTTIKLIHAETKEFIQEFDIQATVRRHQKELGLNDGMVDRLYVTKLEHSPGQLWVGTSCGVVVLLPVPRLGGVPRVMGSPVISHHGNGGPVRIIVPMTSLLRLSVSDEAVEFPGDKARSSPMGPEPTRSPPPLPADKPTDPSPLAKVTSHNPHAEPEGLYDDVRAETLRSNPGAAAGGEGGKQQPVYQNEDAEKQALYQNKNIRDDGEENEDEYVGPHQRSAVGPNGEPIYELAGQPAFMVASDGGGGRGDNAYSRLNSAPHTRQATKPAVATTPASESSLYTSLFAHSELMDPISSIEERRRATQRKQANNTIIVEQHYMVCGGIGYAYHIGKPQRDKRKRGASMDQEDGGQLLVWELHDS